MAFEHSTNGGNGSTARSLEASDKPGHERRAAQTLANSGTNTIETIRIGKSGITASRIAMGTWAIGGWMWGGNNDLVESIHTIRAALEHGITLIDTAPVYGFGRSEEIIGVALSGGLRDRAVIATKAGLEWRNGEVWRNATPARIRKEVEDSLRRLQTDYIDIYQVHWPDPLVPIQETAGALARLLKEGKIRAIGVSNYSPEQMTAFRSRSHPLGATLPTTSLSGRPKAACLHTRRNTTLPSCGGALCRGLLTGTISVTTQFKGDDLRRNDPKFQEPRFSQYLAAVASLDRYARERYGRGVLALAVRWVLDQGDTVALWGARRPAQLDPVQETMGWKLDHQAKTRIDEILKQTVKDPVGPEFGSAFAGTLGAWGLVSCPANSLDGDRHENRNCRNRTDGNLDSATSARRRP
jgi:aryl-alcohol dehydrogenase-like predicted oxidoreductase